MQILTFTSKSRDDITYYDKGQRAVGFAVTTETMVLIAGPLSLSLGAQGAEVFARTEADRYAKGKKVNIYIDSKYTFGVCHATGALWKERGFLTSAGKMIAHGKQIKDLLEVIQLPTALVVIYILKLTQENKMPSQKVTT